MIMRIPALQMLVRKAADWDESKHPRADNGQFGSGSGGSSKPKKPSKTRRKMERREEAASQARVGGAIQSLLSGGSALDKIGWLKTSKKPAEGEGKTVTEEIKPSEGEKKPAQQQPPKYEDIPGAERLVGGPGVIPFSSDKYGGWNGMYHAHGQKVVGKMENGLIRLDVYDADSGKLLTSAKFDPKEDKNFGTNVKGKYGNEKINYLRVNKIPEGFPAYTDRAAIDRKLEVDEYIGNTRESITSTHPDMQRLAIHLDENGMIKSHQLIPITATVQDENAVYVPAFGNEVKAKRAIEDAILHGKYTKGGQEAPKQPEKPKVEEKPEPQNEGKVSFSDIAGESTKSLIKVDGDVDYTKPYIIRISGKTYDHSKNLKSLGFKWGATSKTWYMGIEPKDAESGKNAILQHIQGVSEGRNAIGELKATVSQGKLVPKKPSSQRAAPTPAPKLFPSNPNDGKPGPVPAHEMGSLLSDIDDMEMEIVRYNARRDWEPEVKLSAPISELRRKIEDARARYKESSDRLTSAARYEILSEFEYNKIKPGRRSGPTEGLRELGEKGGLYKK